MEITRRTGGYSMTCDVVQLKVWRGKKDRLPASPTPRGFRSGRESRLFVEGVSIELVRAWRRNLKCSAGVLKTPFKVADTTIDSLITY